MSAPQIIDSTFRTQIHTDIKAAWIAPNVPLAIHDQRPRLPKKLASLPYATVLLTGFNQQFAGPKRVTQTYQYEITFVGSLDVVSGVLDTQKVLLANQLMAVLLSTQLYAGIQGTRIVTGVTLTDGQADGENHPTYEVATTFQIVCDSANQ